MWLLENNTAQLVLPRAALAIDLADLTSGLRNIRAEGAVVGNLQPLAIWRNHQPPPGPSPPQDVYIRGGDLIVTYADFPEAAMRTQIYWRTAAHPPDGALAAVELLISVQTSLLDSCPRLATESSLVANEILRLSDPQLEEFVELAPPPNPDEPTEPCGGPHCYLFRLPASAYSYVEMIYPAVAEMTEVDSLKQGLSFQATLRHQLFAEQLEKGVVLRARLLALLCDRQGDQAMAARHYRAFLADELPLTT